jgi:hypothetical protein
MAEFYELSLTTLFVLFSALGIIIYAVGVLSLRIMVSQAARDRLSIPQPAFLGTIATAWALSLGFIAADIWGINGRADHAVTLERSAITHLLRSSEPDVLGSKALAHGIETYRRHVVEGEWQQGKNVGPMPEVEAAMHEISGAIAELARSDAPSVLVGQVVQDFNDLQEARNLRLAVGSSSVDYYKWYLVIFLTLLTAITAAATHADRPGAGRRALRLFAITASMSLWILAIHANPYEGIEELHPSLLFTSQKHPGVAIDGM